MSANLLAGPPATRGTPHRISVIPLRWRTVVLLAATSAIGVLAFMWPLFADQRSHPDLAHSGDAPWLFVVLLPLLVATVISELSHGRLDAKAVAVLGVLTAAGALARLPSGGLTGVSFMFFFLLPAGRVFGPGFGYVLGALTMFASALLTGGIGPWLPFQMMAAAWVGLGAGLLPSSRGRAEIAWLAGYGVVSALAYGLLLNLWFWPFVGGATNAVSYEAGAPLLDNLSRFWTFHLATSLGFDVPRAAGNFALILVGAGPVLNALRRTTRRAAFGAAVNFEQAQTASGVAPR